MKKSHNKPSHTINVCSIWMFGEKCDELKGLNVVQKVKITYQYVAPTANPNASSTKVCG
jgi:hypothetical protein